MQDSFARARTRPKGRQAKRARDDRVSCIQDRGSRVGSYGLS